MSGVSLIELRFNPMKRTRAPSAITTTSSTRPCAGWIAPAPSTASRAGLILRPARQFSLELNEILVKKAVKYKSRGVVGIDLAGPESHTLELGHEVAGYGDLFARARAAALGTTVHTGETAYTAVPGVLAVLKELAPSRIGHGIAAANSEEALAKLVESGTVLEICPSSNLRTHAVADLQELGLALRAFERAGVRYTINTDGPYLLNTHLRREYQMLIESRHPDGRAGRAKRGRRARGHLHSLKPLPREARVCGYPVRCALAAPARARVCGDSVRCAWQHPALCAGALLRAGNVAGVTARRWWALRGS